MLAFAARTVVKPLGFLKPFSLMKASSRFKAHQDALPRLPVPPLQQSLDHYLKALQPIVSEEEWAHTKQLVDEFQASGGVGERLQKGLERRARKTENWLSEWWLKTAYLQYRQPVVIYSSPGVMLPKQDFVDLQGQLRFAAKLIEGVLDFKVMIDNETLPVEYLGGKPLCMNQYYQILSSCRVPGPKQDTVSNFSKTKKPPTHITVVHNYQFFELDVYHSDGTPLTADQIFVQLEKIWNSSLQTNKEPVGILTSNHRNSWAKAYNTLIKDKVNRDSVRSIQKKPELVRSPLVPLPMPKKLRFNITPEIKSDIEKAKQNLSIMIQDLDITVMVFHHFGKDFPKSEKLSPDAFIQMALQLAYYRIYGQACATYESASLRMFHLGRTDTIRSASMDSLTFVKAMDDSSVTEHQKVELLRKAVQAHRGYTDRAIRGEAFDRHLLGLKLQAIEDLVSMPDIFMDTSYAIAMHFHLSTSQVPAKTDCVMFFGPVVPDGYGVCYNPMEAHINFSLSAYNSCAETNAARLAHYLEKALLDMRALLQSHPRAKL
uniref:Isoform 3 of Carnitine O-acetyltransferase n=1 Tax=Homo sapiens TaxID=9606 RepID=P43155-3